LALIPFILICYGATTIICFGKVFDAIRPKSHLFHCPLCMGFWVGFIMHFLFAALSMALMPSGLLAAFLMGLLSAGTSYVLSALIDDEGLRIVGARPE